MKVIEDMVERLTKLGLPATLKKAPNEIILIVHGRTFRWTWVGEMSDEDVQRQLLTMVFLQMISEGHQAEKYRALKVFIADLLTWDSPGDAFNALIEKMKDANT